ncbi:PIG-L family deacetylase [Candidatus Gottesmanbacteria bacterium]|nr:PIG-L family deacetylase [Candidatus Gottesmanbacteria bacterium]
MGKRLLAVFAHPDDESFGPGGTLAKYAKVGVEIHVLCATKGEAGGSTGTIREKELFAASRVLGVKKVEFLDFIDGELSNNKYHQVAEKILRKITQFKPHVIMTFEPQGVSGHLDHVAISLITTYAFLRQNVAKKLYYYCITKARSAKMADYYIYFPPGYGVEEITTTIDISPVWDTKVKAMKKHQSQIHDVERILIRFKDFPKEENFLKFSSLDKKDFKKSSGFEF